MRGRCSPPTGVVGLVNREIHVAIFGAVGDGATDDYQAFRDIVDYTNHRGGGSVNFESGATYWIDKHCSDPAGDGRENLILTDCKGLTINGNGAKININGNFDRSVQTIFGLSGFWIKDCNNVEIRELEIDGNVQDTTNSSGAIETQTFGLGSTPAPTFCSPTFICTISPRTGFPSLRARPTDRTAMRVSGWSRLTFAAVETPASARRWCSFVPAFSTTVTSNSAAIQAAPTGSTAPRPVWMWSRISMSRRRTRIP